MLFENERGDIRQFTDPIHNGKANVWVILRHTFHDGSLREADTDDEVKTSFSEGTHRGFNRGWIPWLNVAQNDVHRGLVTALAVGPLARLGTLHAGPRRRVERPIVLAANIENDADVYLRLIVRCVGLAVTGKAAEPEQTQE